MSLVEPFYEGLNGARLLPEVAGGPNTGFERRGRRFAQSRPLEQSAFIQEANSDFDIPPCGVLSEDGAEDDLQASARRPPSLRAELLQQGTVILPKHFTGLNSRRLSRALHRLEVNTAFGRKSRFRRNFPILGIAPARSSMRRRDGTRSSGQALSRVIQAAGGGFGDPRTRFAGTQSQGCRRHEGIGIRWE